MGNGKVEICGVNTSKLPVLSAKEKRELFEKIKQGDMEARQRFIYGNLRLVLSILKRFGNRNENIDDLFQIGCIGLIKAVENFDTGHNVQFSTYAVPMIIGEIRRYLRDNNAIRVSRSIRDTAYKALSVKEKLTAESGKEPGIAEIAKEMGLQPEEVSIALDAIVDPVSMQEPLYHDGTDAVFIMDQIKDEKNIDESWLESISLKEAISRLSEREQHIINLRFFQGKTQTEVASEIGISQAQVSRLEKNALNHMRKNL